MDTIKKAHIFGIQATVQGVDSKHIIARATDEVDADARAIEEGNRQADNVTVFKGRGSFVGPKTLEVNGEQISTETVLIAAGTRPMVPKVPGLDGAPYITSDEALRIPEQPLRLAILGEAK